jgi:dissimilatory sulfite reductase (desulfoviridin) alpha/beta subunit
MKTKILSIGLTTLLYSCSNSLTTTPSQVVTKWAQSVQGNRIEEAVGYWDSEKSKGELRSIHIKMADSIQRSGGNEFVKVTEEKVNGEIAEVTFTTKEKLTAVHAGIAKLTKEKGEWKINSVGSQ